MGAGGGVGCVRSGVVCDSAGESGRAAFKSVKRIWPQIAAYCAPAGQPQQLDGEEELFRENDMPAWYDEAGRQGGRGGAA